MASISGTVILCDQVYQAQGGKFVIAGTFTNIEVHVPDLTSVEHQIHGLSLYIRLRPERTGNHVCQVAIRDEMQPIWQPAIMTMNWDVPVTERNMRLVEMAMVSPPFGIRAQSRPPVPFPGSIVLKCSIEFKVDGEIIATTPLDVCFIAGTGHPPAP